MKPPYLTLLTLFLLSLTAPIFAQVPNHLDLLMTMEGEFMGSEFGNAMVSMDFNGDGFKDLVVWSQAWNPTGVYNDNNSYGKLYFYWGGPDFDNVVDFVIPGTYVWEFRSQNNDQKFMNAGDMNGDGIEDLVIHAWSPQFHRQVRLYYGKTNPQTSPDVVLDYSQSVVGGIWIYSLGDINGDNRSDLSLSLVSPNYTSTTSYIWNDVAQLPWLFRHCNNDQWLITLCGIGDINNDGYFDCCLYRPNDEVISNNTIIVYHGSEDFPISDSLVIYENLQTDNRYMSSEVGDVNGDGYGDFIAKINHLWLGNAILSSSCDMQLQSNHGFTEYLDGYPFIHADLNNDGYEDIIGSNPGYGYYDGVMTLWMGRAQMNGTPDLFVFSPPGSHNQNFSWAKAAGDFNADGICEVAVSAPWFAYNDHADLGSVIVYTANTDLHDTTVGVDDQTNTTPIIGKWDIVVFPNPLKLQSSLLTCRFLGAGYKQANKLRFEIYNIKGQKLMSEPIPAKASREGTWQTRLQDISPGAYVIAIRSGRQQLITRKIIIK